MNLTSSEIDAFPSMTLAFEGNSQGTNVVNLQMAPDTVFVRNSYQQNQICLGVKNTGSNGFLIIGDTTMWGWEISILCVCFKDIYIYIFISHSPSSFQLHCSSGQGKQSCWLGSSLSDGMCDVMLAAAFKNQLKSINFFQHHFSNKRLFVWRVIYD